ncbi:MAG TPA: GDCCVxC domain-containing (seleno)protein [Ignavibacteria bacterium]
MNKIIKSRLTCPNCGSSYEEEMPLDSCVYFYECKNCKEILRPVYDGCCVFCSYGSVKYPPIIL